MLALAEYREALCPQCGGWLPETTDPLNEGRYKPALPTRCHQCDGLQLAAEGYTAAQNTPRPGALRHKVQYLGPRPTAAPA